MCHVHPSTNALTTDPLYQLGNIESTRNFKTNSSVINKQGSRNQRSKDVTQIHPKLKTRVAYANFYLTASKYKVHILQERLHPW